MTKIHYSRAITSVPAQLRVDKPNSWNVELVERRSQVVVQKRLHECSTYQSNKLRSRIIKIPSQPREQKNNQKKIFSFELLSSNVRAKIVSNSTENQRSNKLFGHTKSWCVNLTYNNLFISKVKNVRLTKIQYSIKSTFKLINKKVNSRCFGQKLKKT